jgi:Uncharacterized protein conserved in bacteria (DUF2252)
MTERAGARKGCPLSPDLPSILHHLPGSLDMAKTSKNPPSPVAPANPQAHLPPITHGDRRTHGKQLRDAVPRDAHAAWRAHAGRADPINILCAADATRQAELVPLRYGRMLQSPFTFYRGSAGVMAADLAQTPTTGIHVQACGDAHLLYFGGFATPERRLIFDINELDETLPAPWGWDPLPTKESARPFL